MSEYKAWFEIEGERFGLENMKITVTNASPDDIILDWNGPIEPVEKPKYTSFLLLNYWWGK